MKSYYIIPSLMAGVLATVLTGCSSSGSSYSPDHAADKAHQERLEKKAKERAEAERLEKEKAEAEKLAKEKAEKEKLDKAKEEANSEQKNTESSQANKDNANEVKKEAGTLDWREFVIVGSADGGDKYNPAKNKNGDAFYSSGPIVLLKDNKAVKLNDASLNYDRDLFKKGKIDPQAVQSLVITGKNGETLGKFQFVNQEYSTYATFMSAKPANEYDPEYDVSEGLGFYTAKLSTPDQLAAQKGTFNYNGHAIGYLGGKDGKTPTQEAKADVQFKVNFDDKTISGRIENRFDNLGFEKLAFVKDWDENDDPIYIPEYKDNASRPLILKESPITVENGVVGFGHNQEDNVGIKLDNGDYLGFEHYGGVFSGPNLEEVVGQIGNGEDRVMFGATKSELKK